MRNGFADLISTVTFRKAILVTFLSLVVAGCSMVKSITSDKDNKELFKSRDQYVRVIKQDAVKGMKVPPNDHPVLLEPGQLRTALGSLEFMLPNKDKSSPVFEKPELDVLQRYLSNALEQAGPEEDVSFAVIGDYRALYGLAKEQMFTSARVFYREGKLNIIFGDIHGKYNANTSNNKAYDSVDRRLFPLAPGSRTLPTRHEWKLLGYPYQEFYTGPDGQRTDWLVIDLAAMTARAAMGEKETATIPPHAKTVEERLSILNELKNKKMITEEEYQMKRSSILNEL
jgi:hypothetical protein